MNQSTKTYGITADKLNVEFSQKTPLLLFDLREKEQFVKNHVKGSVHAVCGAQAKQKIMPNIPKNIKIVLISDPEEFSKETALMMRTFGLDAYYLEGGFVSWKGSTEMGSTGQTINPEKLESILDKVFLLDVRDSEEFTEFRIPGSVNIPLGKLFDKNTIKKIPLDRPIVTICPHGNRAMVASFALTKAGINSQVLQGGLAGWNQVLKEVIVTQDPRVIQIQKIGKGCLSHIVESNGDAVVIDPLFPPEKYIEIAKKEKFNITGVIDTHQHADHVSAARDLSKSIGAKLYLSKYEGYDYQANFVGNGDVISFGNANLKVIHSPGHTPGSLSFVVDDKYVFTGDILFVESIGRPDLRDKVKEFTEELYITLHEKLLKLPNETLVFPTHHGEKVETTNDAFYSTIKKSKNLPWLDIPKDEFIKKVVAITRQRPMNYRKIIAVNKGELDLVTSQVPDLEIGPNRCAIDTN